MWNFVNSLKAYLIVNLGHGIAFTSFVLKLFFYKLLKRMENVFKICMFYIYIVYNPKMYLVFSKISKDQKIGEKENMFSVLLCLSYIET